MSETRGEMTLERACETLNERSHHGLKWSLWCSTGQTMASVLGEAKGRRDYLLHPDDAIAIAERMERRSEGVTQRLLAYAKGIMHAQDAAKASQPAPAAPPRGGAEGDGDDPYGIADALGVLSRRVEGASDIAIVDVTTSDRGGEGTLSARELRDVVAAASTATRAMQAYHRQSHEIEQILGKALGYPWFRDDPKNFPDATEADGVCVGDHVAESLADEAADKIRDLQDKLAAARLLQGVAARIEGEGEDGA